MRTYQIMTVLATLTFIVCLEWIAFSHSRNAGLLMTAFLAFWWARACTQCIKDERKKEKENE